MAFENLDTSKIFKRGIYLSTKRPNRDPNEFLAEIISVELSQHYGGGDFVTMTYRLLESSDPEQHPVGTERITQQDMKNEKIAGPNLAQFVCAVLGVDPNDDAKVKEIQSAGKLSSAMKLATEKNAFAGRKVRIMVRPHTTKPTVGNGGTVVQGKVIDLNNFKPA